MTLLAEALRLVLEHVSPPQGEPVAAELPAVGGVTAEPLHADRDLPAADLSRMDGYAVLAPVSKGTELKVSGETPAGCPPGDRLAPGCCVRLYTGAVLPAGANAVVEQESVTAPRGAAAIIVSRDVKPGEYVIARGSVARRGAELLPADAPLGPAQVGLAAAVGRMPGVRVIPRVALFTTGRELAPYTAAPAPYQTRDVNGPALTAALKSVGCRIAGVKRLDDQLDILAAGFGAALEDPTVHALITVGGVSVGDYDLVPEALRAVGAQVRLHRLAVKPGRPFLFATGVGGKPIFSLPGNPLSALAMFFELVAPALRKMARRPPPWLPTWPVRLTAPARGDAERQHLALVRTRQNDEGEWLADPLAAAHSADLAAAARADGVLLTPPGVRELPAGTVAPFHPWRPLW